MKFSVIVQIDEYNKWKFCLLLYIASSASVNKQMLKEN